MPFLSFPSENVMLIQFPHPTRLGDITFNSKFRNAPFPLIITASVGSGALLFKFPRRVSIISVFFFKTKTTHNNRRLVVATYGGVVENRIKSFGV